MWFIVIVHYVSLFIRFNSNGRIGHFIQNQTIWPHFLHIGELLILYGAPFCSFIFLSLFIFLILFMNKEFDTPTFFLWYLWNIRRLLYTNVFSNFCDFCFKIATKRLISPGRHWNTSSDYEDETSQTLIKASLHTSLLREHDLRFDLSYFYQVEIIFTLTQTSDHEDA